MKKIILLFLLLFISSCSNETKEFNKDIKYINLEGDLKDKNLEASGLSWYKDNLIVLPQFPHKWDSQFDGALYYIPKARIEDYLTGVNTNPIKGEKLHFIATGLDDIGKMRGSGYEAITFVDDTVFVSIEALNGLNSASYVVRGIIDFENKIVKLDATTKYRIESQTNINNMGEETIFEYKNNIYAVHEANGVNVNESPYVTKLSTKLNDAQKIKMQNIDYRITDASQVDSAGKFFAINYYYPGEYKKLKPMINDEQKDFAIEEIIELQIIGDSLAKTKKLPIVLSDNKSKSGNNWEGIVKFNNGFIIVTDMFPETILGVVEN